MLYLDLPTVALNIEVHVSLALAVRRVQLGNHFLGLHSRVFGKKPWYDLQSFCKLVDAVLFQASVGLTPGADLSRKLYLCAATSCCEPAVLANSLEHIHSIINGPLNVVHVVVGGSTDHDRADPALLVANLEDHNLGVAELVHIDTVGPAELLGSGWGHLGQGSCSGSPGKSSDVPLAHQPHGHHVVLVDVVHSQVADLSASDDHVSATFRDRLDLVFQLGLLAAAEVGQLLSRLQIESVSDVRWGSSLLSAEGNSIRFDSETRVRS